MKRGALLFFILILTLAPTHVLAVYYQTIYGEFLQENRVLPIKRTRHITHIDKTFPEDSLREYKKTTTDFWNYRKGLYADGQQSIEIGKQPGRLRRTLRPPREPIRRSLPTKDSLNRIWRYKKGFKSPREHRLYRRALQLGDDWVSE